ncbi:MAG: hypothetical protein P1U39_02600 [Legionellaceae bacterium]|nr:hypothetical protein [Legionellaceae bacterium]
MPSIESPLSFARMKQDFFAQKSRWAEAAPRFLLQNQAKIAEEHQHLTAALNSTRHHETQEAYEPYHQFKAYCEELLALHDRTLRQDIKKPIRDKIIYLHVARIMLSSARFVVLQSIDLLDKAHGFGPNIDPTIMIKRLMVPMPYFSVLSVAIPALRLITDFANIAKHALYPTEETDATHELSLQERFASELYRAGTTLLNDAQWVIINILSSYPQIFCLSLPAASALVLIGLAMDICFLLYNYNKSDQAYLEKKAQYEDEIISNYPGIIPAMSQRQLLELELSYCGIKSGYNLSLLAGSVILGGFSLLITAPVPILAPIGGLICLLGTSLYLTAQAYAYYEQLNFIDEYNHSSEQATHDAWNSFITSLITNVCFPVVLMGTFAASPPVALLVLIGFMTFKLQSADPEPLAALSYA